MALLDIPISVNKSSRYLTAPGKNGIPYICNGSAQSLISSTDFVKHKSRCMKIAAAMASPSIDRGKVVKYPEHPAWESVKQERWEGELQIEGKIPDWLNGTYLRNGPGMYDIGQDSKNLFDGYSTLVRLHFENGNASATHAQLQSEAYMAAKKYNKVCYREFSELPKPSNILSTIGNMVGVLSGDAVTDNAIISVIRMGDGRVVCLTETMKGTIQIDPNSLETIGPIKYTDKLGGFNQSGHPLVFDSELISLLPDFINPGYNVIRMPSGTNQRNLIGKVKCKSGPSVGWVHSFTVTDNFVIVPEMPMKYSLENMLSGDLLQWHQDAKAFMHVVSKETGETVASVEVPQFMTFHFINAYEEKDKATGKPISIIVDCCEYNSSVTIMERLFLDELRSFSGEDCLPDSRVGRFTIPLNGSPRGTLDTAVPPKVHGKGIDMCSINSKYRGKEYRYAYGCAAERPCHYLNSLTKIDLKDKSAKKWYSEGSIPSEPFFIERPGAESEDDGVVISIVSDKDGDGFAVVLDGSTFTEVARAKLPYGLPYGLHGCWIPS
ncbi:carotenoid cleavage dioxygenase 8 homolog B, chloroplastic-like [Cryptomeria japonica]|uniref:carotenoid cleavage dioxygenase 8 homolog B, chloroplastic-like n=1 Tax=Cryptomeria japonica TaxID=3369 RepID=UPI0027DA0889|nr:carotenoid cleavage dioxygenase 8 homolog B, chloroplastic-like [Cryptomeria japonica]